MYVTTGSRFQATHQNKIELASRFIYNALTTMLGTQTLGEEYCDIMQISDSTKTYPSFLRRFLLVTFTSGGRIGLRYLISSLQQRLLVHRLRHPNKHAVRWVEIVVEWLSKSDNFEWTASTVATLHLLIFYFTGKYYHLSKRLSGIRYVFMRPLRQGEEPIGYEVLGLLLLIQTIVRLVKYAADKRRARIDASKDQSPPPEGALATSSTKLRWADLDNIDQSKDQVTDGQKQQS
ncbi:peroxisome biogenesis factor 10, partial [Spiromyces aspiralis]